MNRHPSLHFIVLWLWRPIFVRALLGLVLACTLVPAATHAASSDTQLFSDRGYGDTTARTMDSTLEYYFAFPHGKVPQKGAQLDLIYSHSPLLIEDRSTMTVVVNGQSLASVFLTKQNQDRAKLVVSLPYADGVKPFNATGYFVQLQFHMRLTRDTCEEVRNPALWTTVHGESALVLPTQPLSDNPTLDSAPDLFTPTKDEKPLTLVVPAVPQPEELDAAGLVAFEVGRWAAQNGAEARLRVATTPPIDSASIKVASGAALTKGETWGDVSWNGQDFQASSSVPSGQGVLAVRGGETPQLLVSGATPTATLQAARALVEQSSAMLTANSVTFTGKPFATTPEFSAWKEGAASFAQLGITRQNITGPGEHSLNFSFERPADWVLRDGGTLDLALVTSSAIRNETSWVAASVNGYDLGTQRLTASGDTSAQHYRFTLPTDLLNTDANGQPLRQLALQVRVFLDTPHTNCEDIPGESSWAALQPTSALMLPYDTYSGMDLGRFPAPLMSVANAPLTLVLPVQPTTDELAAAMQTLATLGQHTVYQNWTPAHVVTADQPDSDALAKTDLILIGGADHNTISAEAVQRNSDLGSAIDPATYQAGESTDAGQLRLARSPWASSHTLLMLTGGGTTGLDLAVKALADTKLFATLHGEHAIVVTGLPPQTISTSTPVESPPSELTPRVVIPISQRMPAWQIVGAILLGAFVAALAVIFITRLRRPHGVAQ